MDTKIFEASNMSKRSPGPASYKLKPVIGMLATDPTIERNPAYTMMARRDVKVVVVGPGPKYDVSTWNQHGKNRAPGGVLGRQFGNTKKQSTPGPADYNTKSTLAHTGFVLPTHLHKSDKLPKTHLGPPLYLLPDSLEKRGAKIANRLDKSKLIETPGPASYNIPNGDLYLSGRHRGGRTIAPRPKVRKLVDAPGPASYFVPVEVPCLYSPSPDVCRTTFGRKRPENAPPFAVPGDNQFDSDCCR